jgi:hypothetical protein
MELHSLLKDRLSLDDPDDLQRKATVARRVHGTAMASLILHGDLNTKGPTLKVVLDHFSQPTSSLGSCAPPWRPRTSPIRRPDRWFVTYLPLKWTGTLKVNEPPPTSDGGAGNGFARRTISSAF